MKTPRRTGRSLSFNITPLIDITFLLIVFFVMSNRMIREEVAMELALPRESSGETIRDDESGKIIINVTEEGEYYFGAKRMSLEELGARLKRERATATRETTVRIRAGRATPYSRIEPILTLCARSGFSDVSFAVVGE